jgi:hypothetical protein
MSRKPVLIDVVPRHQRTAQRNARREGISSRRDVVDNDDVRDEFIENIRQHQSITEHFDVNESLGQRSVHPSPHSVLSSSPSASSAASDDTAAFAASSRVRRSPISNETGVSDILASLQRMRRSPSIPPVPRDVVALGVNEHRDDVNEDEQRDRFQSNEQVNRLPMHDAPSQAYYSATYGPQRVGDTVDRARALIHTSATPFDTSTSSSSSPTPGGYRGEQLSRQTAVERELESMRRQLNELQQSHKTKNDIINDLVKSRQAERQRRIEMQQVMKTDARALVNNVTRPSHTVVKTENNNEPSSLPLPAVHSPLSLAFPSLSPSGSPSLVVGAPMKEDRSKADDDAQVEHKYDVEDKKIACRIGDLPDVADEDEIDCSDDEVEIRRRDARPDPTIKEKEPDSDNHLDSYPEWALRRETLYPFSRYKHLYSTRHSLLTALDRKNEWMRFGILTHFNAKLYGLTARHWFESYMQELGDPLIGAKTHKTRNVAKKALNIPEMWYDPRDDFSEAVDEETQDLQENSYTFEQLPAPLRDMPPSHERADQHHHELIQLVNTHVYHRRLKKVAQQPATPDNRPITQDMRDEEHPCARCKVPVYSVLKHMCTACEDAVKHTRLAAIEAGYRPPLETADPVRQQPVDTVPTADAPVNKQKAPSVKSEKAFSLMIGTYTDPSAATDTGDCDNAPVTRVKKEHIPLTYREQEAELTLMHHRTTDAVKASASTEEDIDEESESPLGNILSTVFQPHQRQLQRRLRRTNIGGFRDHVAAVTAAVTTIGKFDGTAGDAPMYLLNLCSQAQQFGFDEAEIISLMQRTMTGNALTWLNSNMHEVFTIKYKPLQVLLHRFRKQYIGAHITRDLRKQMASTVLTNDSLTMKELDTHYATYKQLLMRLQMSDKQVDDEETTMEFFTSLPRSVRAFIGSNIDKCNNVHDVYMMAQRCVLLNPTRAGVRQDGDLPRTIGINALPAGKKPSSKYAEKSGDRSKPRPSTQPVDKDKATAQCYHCGDRGHYTGDCALGKSPQTLKGNEAWAKRNKDNGWTFPYDQQWWIEKSKEIAAKKAAYIKSKQPPRERPNRRASKEDAINVSSGDDTSPDEHDDE